MAHTSSTGAYKPLNEVYEPVLDVPVVFIALRNNDEDLWKVRGERLKL